MTRSRTSALSRSYRYHSWSSRMCLKFVRSMYGVGARYGSAISAWNHASHKHRTSSTAHIPKGAPIFFTKRGHPYGHVALYAGSGMMRTTSGSRVVTNSVSSWIRGGWHLIGWTEDINGHHIPGLWGSSSSAPQHHYATVRYGSHGSTVKHVQTRLRAFGYHISVDGSFGPATRSAVRSFQRKHGLSVDGVVGPRTRAKLG